MRRAGVALVMAVLLLDGCSRAKQPPLITKQQSADQTRPAAEWLREEPVRLLQEYVHIDTTRERGEQEGAEYLHRFFDCAGIENEVVCPEPRRCNVLARLAGRRREGALLLLNHIDVVGVFPELWKEASPFSGMIKGGYLYGRGTYDMKSLCLVQALAMRELKSRGIVPESDVLFLAEADEESGQRWGSQWLLENRPEWFRNVAAVLNEGAVNEMILRTVRFWGIETVQGGYGFVVFDSGSEQMLKDLVKAIPKLQEPPVTPLPQVVMGFGMLANHLEHPLTDPLRHLDRVIRNPAELALLPDRYGSFLEPRMFWGGPFAYPPRQAANFRCFAIVMTPPGVAPDPFLPPLIEEGRRRGARLFESGSTGPTSASPYPTPFTDLLARILQARYPGVPVGPVPTAGGATTSNYFRDRGIPAYGFSTIAMNSFDASRRHGNDERIYLRDYVDGVALFREALEEFAFFGGYKLSPGLR